MAAPSEEREVFDWPAIGAFVATALVALVVIWTLLCLLVAWPFRQTGADEIGLSYGGGIIEGAHFQKIVEPGTGRFMNGWGDRFYTYPVTQRNYIVSKNPEEGDREEPDFITAVTQDQVTVEWETFTTFRLNTDLIREFHERLGLKFHAWTDGGWDEMLDQTLRQVQENALQRITRDFTAADLRAGASALEEVQAAVGAEMNRRIIPVLTGNFFCNPDWNPGEECADMQFGVKKVTVPDNIAQAYNENAQSLIDVQTKENEVEQRRQEARAIQELNAALEAAGEQYVLLRAVESGAIQFWVVPSDTNLTLPTPSAPPDGE